VRGPGLSRWDRSSNVGGARGNVARAFWSGRIRTCAAWCSDVPGVEPLFDEHMAALGIAGQVSFPRW